MDNESLQKELDEAYAKLTQVEDNLTRAKQDLSKQYKVEEILIATGS